MGCLLGGPSEKDLSPTDWAEHKKEQASAWHSWRAVVAGLLVTVMVEDDAREQLEARYLGGRPSLLADAEREWTRFAEMVDHLWSLAEKLVPLTRAEERRLSKDAGQQYDQRVQARSRKLADDARISTFDRLGENSRALAILERRLGGRAAMQRKAIGVEAREASPSAQGFCPLLSRLVNGKPAAFLSRYLTRGLCSG
jgi:hypothetical protein